MKTRRGPLTRFARAGLNLLYGAECACCGGEFEHQAAGSVTEPRICADCRQRLVADRPGTCPRCGAITPAEHDAANCSRCQGRRYRFDRVLSLGSYENDLRAAALRLKRTHQEPLTRALTDLVWQVQADQLLAMPLDVVTSVPMHWRRRLIRGVNSPDLIAERIARLRGLPLATGLARRRRYTAPQADVPPSQRFRNIRGAFRATRRYYLGAARVLLVDDILTTGATCSEVAKVLRAAGAAEVTVLVLARAEGAT